MALLNCPECGKEISSNAKTCPHCGCEVTVCPDCNAVFAQKPEVCPSCGHVFNNVIHNVEQSVQDEFKYYIKGKLTFLKIMRSIQIILAVLNAVAFAAIIIVLSTLSKDDPIEYLYALHNAQQTAHVLIICCGIAEFIAQSITVVFNLQCNFLHTLAANEMSLCEIDGVQYCKEHQTTLNNVNKKASEWTFALNAAYRQDNKSSIKYNILIVVFGLMFYAIQAICLTICLYQILDKGIYCLVWDVEFDFLGSLNYVALVLWLVAAIADIIVQTTLQNKHAEDLKKWCLSKSLPVDIK